MSTQRLRNRILPYIYIAPAGLMLLLVFIFPVFDLLQRSTTKTVGGEKVFTGLTAYQNAVQDPIFWTSISNNLRLILAVPILVILALIFASLIFERLRGWQLYRTMAFIPYVMAIPVVGIIFSYILQFNGALNSLLRGIGLEFLARDWLGSTKTAIWTIMFVVIWKELGFGIILFLARMSSISEDLFDAAKLDGASWFARLRHVTIPQTASVIEFYAIINLITMLSWVFSYILVMTKGGPGNQTWVLEYFIYQKAFPYSQMQIASAAAILLLLFASIPIFLVARMRSEIEGLES